MTFFGSGSSSISVVAASSVGLAIAVSEKRSTRSIGAADHLRRGLATSREAAGMWHAGDAPADVARVASATGTAARARRLGEDLDRARVVGAEDGLDGHVEVAERLEVMREGQGA